MSETIAAGFAALKAEGGGPSLPSMRVDRAGRAGCALARIGEIAREIGKRGIVVVDFCGSGDKDVFTVADARGKRI